MISLFKFEEEEEGEEEDDDLIILHLLELISHHPYTIIIISSSPKFHQPRIGLRKDDYEKGRIRLLRFAGVALRVAGKMCMQVRTYVPTFCS